MRFESVVACVVVLCSGCDFTKLQKPDGCIEDGDCPGGEVCLEDHACHGVCDTSRDCSASNEACIDGNCVAYSSACAETVECTEGFYCLTGARQKIPDDFDCGNQFTDGEETDVDCGGTFCEACGDGEGCALGADCASGVCDGVACLPPTCGDEVTNGTETDVDCGGECEADCAAEQHCTLNSDCTSQVCLDSTCQQPDCGDETLNGEESDVDCGGTECGACPVSWSCNGDADCGTNRCDAFVCEPAECPDGRQNAAETDVDCGGGGLCPPCDDGLGCVASDDCESHVCDGTCQPPSCEDTAVNGDETGLNCGGGVCGPCAIGLGCIGNEDCISELCDEVCLDSCHDGVLNGLETAEDCGGPTCSPCRVAETCEENTDCLSGSCDVVCQDTCGNAAWDGDETDEDCGGRECGPCDDGLACTFARDCARGWCFQGECSGKRLALGWRHTCILDSGDVRCWGAAASGQLGYGNGEPIGDDEDPSAAGTVSIGGEAVDLAAGDNMTCAVLSSGAVRCWGYNTSGELGLGPAGPTPAQNMFIGDSELPNGFGPIDLGGPALQVSVGYNAACALLTSRQVRCWGFGANGGLGISPPPDAIGDDETPGSVAPIAIGGPAVQIVTEGNYSCAIMLSGGTRCWGAAGVVMGYGSLQKIGDDEDPSTWGDVNLGGRAVQIESSGGHTCALLENGDVRCFGYNDYGQLGNGSTTDTGLGETPVSSAPVNIGGAAVRQLAAGSSHTCALLEDGELRCWGTGAAIGYGVPGLIVGDNETPAAYVSANGSVDLGASAIAIASGRDHLCALLDADVLRCWGYGIHSQLGYPDYGTGAENVGDDEVPAIVGNVTYK